MLSLTDVRLALAGRQILDRLSLTAPAGQVTSLLGPNGAGKTTAVRCCLGLLTPQSGTVSLLGRAPGHAEALARIGLMPQATGAWSAVRPGELLRYLAGLYADPLPVADLVDRLELGPFLTTPYRRLSGGQQQAVNLAGALVGRPAFVLLDEPTAGMDPHARRRTWDVIGELRDSGVGVLLTTHAMDEAARLADHVWIMDAGRITLDGTVAGLTATEPLEEVFLRNTRRPV